MGWQIKGKEIDFSEEALAEIGKFIKQKAMLLLKSCKKAGIAPSFRIPFLIRQANQAAEAAKITSSFRIVTVPDGLQKIDRMICDAIRYAATGRKGNGKYRLSYRTIQAWGHHSLVSQYYAHLNRHDGLDETENNNS